MRMVVTPVMVSPDAMAHWMGAAPRYFGSSEAVQVDVAERRQVDHPLRNDAAVADDNDRLRPDALELRTKFFVVLDLLRLDDGQVELQRFALYRRRGRAPCRVRWRDRAG